MSLQNDRKIDDDFAAIASLDGHIHALNERAVREYGQVIEDIIRNGSRDVQHIERTLDGLLDICGHEPIVELFRRPCRHYWHIDPKAAASYAQSYREMWDSSEAAGTESCR